MNTAKAPEKNLSSANGIHSASGHAVEVETFPLSFAQQRLWFFDQFEHAKAAYNLQTVLSVKGPLNVPALQYSLNQIIQRHESLRTRFALASEGPVQVIEPELHLELAHADVSALAAGELAAGEPEKVLDRLVEKDWEKEFDLTCLPLIRATLVKRNTDDHVLLLTMHHIISDGWSMRVLFREVGEFYGAYVAGKQPQMEELEVQYVDFALWQQEWLQGERLQRQLDYWRKALEGAPELLELPLDKTRPATQSYRGAEEGLVLGEMATRKMKQLGQQHGTTLYMNLVAAFCVLLKRYSGASDMVIGTPVANRSQQELEALIGFFVNTLALRFTLAGNPTFSEVLQQVREVVLSAFEHQDMPFQKLVEALQPERNLSHHPLFQVMFVLHNSHGRRVTWPGLQVSSLKEWPGAGVFDLVWSLREHDERLSIQARYSADLFEAATVQRMMRHYERVLEELSRDAGQRVAEFQLLSDGEWKQITEEWAGHDLPYEREKTVATLFEEQVNRNPNAVAVVFKEERFTYENLNKQANQLANHLKQLGVGPEIRVGAFMQRGPRMILAMLAIWKAGGVYVPLDPDYPPERLSYMLRDTDPLIVLSETGTKNVLAITNASVIDIKGDWVNIAKNSESSPESAARTGNAAYIIYTSGSTGRPKGVMITHGSVSNLIRAQRETFAPGESDRILQFFSFSFDVSIFAVLMALGSGASLVLATREELLPSAALVELLEAEGITLAVMPPLVLSHMPDAELPALRKIILGGEVWGEELMKRWDSGRRFFNSYGPTETTVQAAVGEYHLGAGRPSIGRPISNARIYLLDLEGNPVPVGVAGELHIGGDGLGRGYLDCALTAEKFVPDPFNKTPGKRLYRTGDWARWLPDGNIDLLGRKDDQIKLRGFRVELGEIESVLSEHPLVRQCAVVALQGKSNAEKQLVAYATLRDNASSAERELRSYLKEKLPDYMVPAQFMILEEFPLNHSGKIDRNRLPIPKAERSAGERGPRTPEEEILCGLFAEVLELERVGIDDNFFDLGGHSLKATRLASRVRSMLGVELPLRTLFESPTVAGLRPHLRQAEKARAPLAAEARPERLPMSYAQQRLWFLDQLQGKSTEYNIPEALRLRGELDYPAFERAMTAIVQRHEILRTRFAEAEDGQPVQIIDPESSVVLQIEDLSGLDESSRQGRIAAAKRNEREQAFDLARGPLLRMKLFKLDEREHVLLRTLHHIVTDGWSQGTFNREFMLFYEAFHQNQAYPLPPLSIQYADFALWQRKWLDKTLEGQLAYWKQELAGIPEELALPKDRPRPPRQTFDAEACRISLSPEQTALLKRLSQDRQSTLFMTLLTLFAMLLQRYSGQDDIVLGSPIANRQEEQLEQLIGFFVNSLVLRVRVEPAQTFTELLSGVRKMALDAYRHQDLPFERLVEELSPQRSLNKTPLYQVLFLLQNAPMQSPALKGVEMELLPGEGLHTHFDMELHAMERGDTIALLWVYNRDLFDRWRIEQMARHYKRLVDTAIAGPDLPLYRLEMLEEAEKQQILLEWNSTKREYAAQDALHAMFEAQAARTPEAPAVICGGRSTCYQDLNERANRLAHYLIKLGVGSETRVGVCVERSTEMVAAMLAVLKAGGAYVPLDPRYPAERLSYMLEDSQAKVLITEHLLFQHLPPFAGMVVELDSQRAEIAAMSSQNPAVDISPENLAYAIYTSGSTGKPKGVAICHSSAVAFLGWCRDAFLTEELFRVLASTSICFDLSVFEIFAPLSCGGSTIVVSNALELAESARTTGVTLVNTVPSAMRELVRMKGIPESVRVINLAGEALSGALVREIYQTTKAEKVFNLYGPSEDTTYSTFTCVPRAHEGTTAPIGKPIANSQVYVLDDWMHVVPVGVVGQLYVAGAGLARGYLNRPGLTAESFIPDPFGTSAGGRMYRTGDLVKWSADGNLEFLGRADHQVKVRGFRIELGEIEAVLQQHAEVEHAVVLAREDGSGEKRLTAYVVARGRQEESARTLSKYLKGKLPEHMSPAYFVFLDRLPLTENGKVNRKALPNPQQPAAAVYLAPRTAIQQLIAKIWQEALAVDRVGLDDNFFDLGGHSLLVARVRFTLREKLGRDIALVDFFTYPTVRTLAQRLEESAEKKPVNVTDSQMRAARQKAGMLRHRQIAHKTKAEKEPA